MKASELRIGNKIKNIKDTEFNVLPEDFLEINANPDNYQGIPLTEEWLLKFGWVWNEESKSYEKYPNGDARMNIVFKPVSCSYAMFNYVLQAVICKNIFYVHQLQNLYFALTGKELEIK